MPLASWRPVCRSGQGGPGGWDCGQHPRGPLTPGPTATRPGLPGEEGQALWRAGGEGPGEGRGGCLPLLLARRSAKGPEPGEPRGAIRCRAAACQGLELGWLPGREAPTPRPAPSNAEAAPLGRLLQGSALISAWSCQAHHKPPEPYQPRNTCPPTGLPTKAQVRLGGFPKPRWPQLPSVGGRGESPELLEDIRASVHPSAQGRPRRGWPHAAQQAHRPHGGSRQTPPGEEPEAGAPAHTPREERSQGSPQQAALLSLWVLEDVGSSRDGVRDKGIQHRSTDLAWPRSRPPTHPPHCTEGPGELSGQERRL